MDKSRNHILFFTDGTGAVYELFARDGVIIYADVRLPVMPDGYRAGRFESIDSEHHRRMILERIQRNAPYGWRIVDDAQ
jgi:hypothetical protein